MNEYKIIIGIDPGASGAITYAKLKDNKLITTPEVIAMPKDFEEMNKTFRELTEGFDRCLCFIEKVNVRPSDMHGGKAFSMMKLIKNYDRIKDVMRLNKIGFIEVHPKTWQSYLKLNLSKGIKEEQKDRKNRYKLAAAEMFPTIRATLKNCDALLLLTFGVKKLQMDRQYILKNIPDIDMDLLF